MLIAALAVSLALPKLVLVARRKSIVDNPNARRLNKKPVPVLGGVGVFFGAFLAVGLMGFAADCTVLYYLLLSAFLMLFVGVMDDILGLSPRLRFAMQVVAVCILMFFAGYRIDDLHGLWGIYTLPGWVAYPLTLLAAVGVINAINLIDGVDGLSSGYGMMACAFCGAAFLTAHDYEFAIVAFAFVGALFPFFLHNVFGRKYKMFIGDGGSLVLGCVMACFIMRLLQSDSLTGHYRGLVSFTLAVFAVPVFDTLRVMILRMMKGNSPFLPDKTHLHHMFISMRYSHAGTTLAILLLNLAVVVVWLASDMLAMPQGWQLVLVVGAAFTATWGVWFSLQYVRTRYPRRFVRMRMNIYERRLKRDGVFLRIQRMLDSI